MEKAQFLVRKRQNEILLHNNLLELFQIWWYYLFIKPKSGFE